MNTSTLIRLGGFAALTAGVVALLSNLGAAFGLIPAVIDSYRSLGTILLSLFALTGLYAAQSQRAGVLGLAGYVLGMLGLAGNVGLRFIFGFVAPILMAQYPEAAAAVGAGPLMAAMSITFLVYAAGYIAFGLATWRAGLLPRWAAALVVVGALLSYVLVGLSFNVGGLLVNVGMIGLGGALVAGRAEAETETPARFQAV